jgi:hypothetical protein
MFDLLEIITPTTAAAIITTIIPATSGTTYPGSGVGFDVVLTCAGE